MEKEIQQHQRDIDGSKFLVSRHDRDGPQYTASSGNKYTLDVDFCWLNYLSALADSDTENIYVVGSNHVAWHLSLATAIYNATNNAPANVTLVLPSYLTHPEGLDEIINGGYQQQEKFHNRALILSSLSWNDKNSQWNKHLPKKARCTPSTLNGELTNLPVQKVIPLITNRQNIVTYFAGKQEDNFLNSFYTKVLYGA
jgi:hypothetical protein